MAREHAARRLTCARVTSAPGSVSLDSIAAASHPQIGVARRAL
jgi:hypothetical protein